MPELGPSDLAVGDPQLDTRAFRRALAQFATGVTVVTAAVAGDIVGVTANSFSSVSLDPPLVSWALAHSSRSLKALLSASHFSVNVLAEDQIELAARFARSTHDKFAGVDWRPGRGGAPLLAGVAACFECKREAEYPGGDHMIMLGLVEQFHHHQRDPLLYAQGRYALATEHPTLRDRLTSPATQFADNSADTTLVSLLFRAYHNVSAAFEIHRETEGLSRNQSLVLAVLADVPNATNDYLGEVSLISASDIDDVVKSLLERKLVESATLPPRAERSARWPHVNQSAR